MVDFWDSVLRMVSALAVVLALMAGLVALLRRFSGTRFFAPVSAPIVQVLGSGYLGPRKTISLVSVAGEFLIVGVTPTDLVSFGRITDQEQVRQLLANAAVAPSSMCPPAPSAGRDIRDTPETKGGHATA